MSHEIFIRPMTSVNTCDAMFIYACRYDTESIKNSFTQTIPSFDEHRAWLENKISGGRCKYFLAFDGKSFIGFVRFDEVDNGIDISICVMSHYRGKHIASEIMCKAIIMHGGDTSKMFATIKFENTKSLRCFATASSVLATVMFLNHNKHKCVDQI